MTTTTTRRASGLGPLGLARARTRSSPPKPPRPPRKPWTDAAPFHVATRHINGAFAGYDVYVKNRLFLRQVSADAAETDVRTPRLKRHEAYAIARLLNGEQSLRRWADKFGDPYVEAS